MSGRISKLVVIQLAWRIKLLKKVVCYNYSIARDFTFQYSKLFACVNVVILMAL